MTTKGQLSLDMGGYSIIGKSMIQVTTFAPIVPANAKLLRMKDVLMTYTSKTLNCNNDIVVEVPGHLRYALCFNLIDKSPLIGSIARTLSWDEPVVGPITPVYGKTSTTPLSPEEEEQECFFYVQTLLSVARN
ncbi:hypothetical protein CTI12_AA445350 [Artemisia annua]|uniref:Uncharacterized protein n=1 Tax=Artemisia annua TaxID=35608 RepID=A0A2U1LWM0_ARTAN|nr:hypothetical protein CTI12_AA445350 [Artemisia annua]